MISRSGRQRQVATGTRTGTSNMSTDQVPAKLMYSCKMCPYTNSTQEAIAVHFLKQHMDVDFCSLSEPVTDDSHANQQESLGDQSETIKDEEPTSVSSRRRTRTKRKSTKFKTVVSEKSFEDTALKKLTDDSDTSKGKEMRVKRGQKHMAKKQDVTSSAHESTDENLGRGKRRKSTPKRFLTEIDQANEPDTELKTDLSPVTTNRKHENCEAIDETEAIESSQQLEGGLSEAMRRQEDVMPDTNSQSQKPVEKKATSKISKIIREKRVPPRKVTSSRSPRNSSTTSSKCSKAETINQKIKRLPIPFMQFKKKLESMVNIWNAEQETKKESLFRTCSFSDCEIKQADDEMKLHESCHVKSMDGLRCPQCEFMCLHWRHMRKHLKNKHELWIERTYQCDQENCENKFSRSNQLRKHVMDKHFKEDLLEKVLKGDYDSKDFELDEAGAPTCVRKRRRDRQEGDSEGRKKIKRRRFADVDDNGNAVENDRRDQVTFVCDLCLSKFKDEDMMELHKNEHDTNQQELLFCPECGTVFEGSDALKDHYRKEHKRKLMRHQCHECPFATDKFYQMNAHMSVHTGQKGVMCDQCGKILANQYNLKVHEYRKHSTAEQMTVACSACPYKCADKSILRDHIKQHHKSMLKNPIYHNCPHCDYVGHKRQSLEFHMRVHTEQRRFKCHLCPYAGKTKNHLKIHMQTHDGFQSASCPDCDFKAASKKRLSEHIMRRHLEVEPYLCKICGWRTAYSGNMWKHTSQHKKKLGDDMPDDPVAVQIELLKGRVLPEMPKAPTGKTRGQSGWGSIGDLAINSPQAGQVEMCVDELARKQDANAAPENDQLQVLQFSGDETHRTYIGDGNEEIQIVQISEDALGMSSGLGEQVVAHIQHGDSQIPHQSSRMEIFITHDAVGGADEAEKAVEVLHVREDGSIVSSTMNRDVEVAVLALAQLEPGTHTTELPTGGGDGGRITILQTVQQNQGTDPEPQPIPATEDGIQVDPSIDNKTSSDANAIMETPHGQNCESLSCNTQEPIPSEV